MPHTPPPKSIRPRGILLAISAVILALLTGVLLQTIGSMPREAAWMAGIFVLAAVLWTTEAIPLFATSLLVIGLEVVLLANPGNWPGLGFEVADPVSYQSILAAAADPVLLLFFGGFLLARAAVKEGVDLGMSALLLKPFGGRPSMILLGLMLVTAVFSMWMSNTATTAMMITLVAPMLAQVPAGDPIRKALVLAVPFAANVGGVGTPIASPPNAVAMGFLQKAGVEITFLQWMLVAVPLMLILLVFTWQLLLRMFPTRSPALRFTLSSQTLNSRGWFVVAVFGFTVLLWMTDRLHGLPAAIVALIPAVAFTASGILNRTDLNSLEWNILILIAGGIALGAGMQMTGLDQRIVQWLPSAESGAFILLSALVIGTVVLGTFMSNTAAANLILPIGAASASMSQGEGLPITQAAICIAIAASMSMALPISTPPNAIAYGAGEISTRDMARAGVIVGVAGVVLILAGAPLVFRLWGL